MTINQEIKERIFTAADELYAASKDGEYPRIEDVRQLSRAGMNTVAEVMKEWRQLQRKQIQTIREPIPADLQVVLQEMGQSLWATALQLVNNSLEAARATFEAERTDLIELSEQLSEAFDKQAEAIERANDELEKAKVLNEKQTLELAGSISRSDKAEARITEVERRATDLRAELDRAHQDIDRLRTENQQAIGKIESMEHAHQEQRKQAAAESLRLAERMTRIQDERDDAIRLAAEARERAAGLAGQLEATQTQLNALLSRFPKINNATE